MNPWALYDGLISRADDDVIDSVEMGYSWTMVTTKKGHVGLASAQAGADAGGMAVDYKNMPLSDAAALVKSWDFQEASVGLAAVNALLNRSALFGQQNNPDAFIRYRPRAEGKKVAVVGHFSYLEKRLCGICDLYVLERRPMPGDIPDPACEYLLPDMDVVFITGSAVINKTMPRLLELSRNAFTVVCGPSTPMDSILFELGANALCGFCVVDRELCRKKVLENEAVFSCGRMVTVERGD